MLSKKQTRTLLELLCVRLGFCLPPDEVRRIVENPPEQVDGLTDTIFRAEGLDPETADRTLYRDVRELVANAFSQDETAEDREG